MSLPARADHRRGFAAAAYLACLYLSAGCTNVESARPAELGIAVHDSTAPRVIELSRTPTEVATGEVEAVHLRPGLRIGESAESWFGAITDIAALGDGRFAVFDRVEKHITVFDSVGARIALYGREGSGPGEYQRPWALTAVGDRLVAWQRRSSATFTVIGPTGAVLSTGAATVPGDWAEPTFRFPLTNLLGTQHGPEDVTRRLAALGDSGFIVQLQLNEKDHIDWEAPIDFPAPPVYLIRYGLDAEIRDTLAMLTGPPTLLWKRLPANGQTMVVYEQPFFSGRPVWAAGRGWLALGHGDSTRVVVRDLSSGDTAAVVRWPARRRPVSDLDRVETVRWLVAMQVIHSSESREMFERGSPREHREGIEWEASEIHAFADSVPLVTAAYGVGECLFLAGFSPADWADGTALTWVALNVVRGSLEAVFRMMPPEIQPLELERRGGAVRAFDRRFAYTHFTDGNGVHLVQRYQLPEMSCG